jgi:hypothetical protein
VTVTCGRNDDEAAVDRTQMSCMCSLPFRFSMITNLKTRLLAILRPRALIVLGAEFLRIPIDICAARSAAACSESVTGATAATGLPLSTVKVSA